MFTQKKRRSYMPLFIGLLFLIVIILIFVFFWRNGDTTSKEISKEATNTEIAVEENKNKEIPKKETYYLVKYDNNNIVIYFSDEEGSLTKLEDTTIVFDTLNQEDQSRFTKGIKLSNREQLNQLIMNYES